LVPNTPPLKDVLAWLSSKKHEINITHLNYALIKYPKMGESHEPYQVKVILEFTAPTPTIAREFYDSLLQDDRLVNTKQVVTWDASQNTYKVSFIVRAQ
jgi:type IV pilus assembly protein PilM